MSLNVRPTFMEWPINYTKTPLDILGTLYASKKC